MNEKRQYLTGATPRESDKLLNFPPEGSFSRAYKVSCPLGADYPALFFKKSNRMLRIFRKKQKAEHHDDTE